MCIRDSAGIDPEDEEAPTAVLCIETALPNVDVALWVPLVTAEGNDEVPDPTLCDDMAALLATVELEA